MGNSDSIRLAIEIDNIRSVAETDILELRSRIAAGESLDDILASKANTMVNHAGKTANDRLRALELASIRIEKLLDRNYHQITHLINNLL